MLVLSKEEGTEILVDVFAKTETEAIPFSNEN